MGIFREPAGLTAPSGGKQGGRRGCIFRDRLCTIQVTNWGFIALYAIWAFCKAASTLIAAT